MLFGLILGGIGSIVVIGATLAFCRMFKREPKIPAFESSSVPRAFPSGLVHATSIRKRPLDAQEDPPSPERPSRNYRFFSKRPLIPPATDIEQGVSGTHSFANPLVSVAPTQPNPARTLPSAVIAPSVGTESMETYSEDDDGDQLVGGRTRADGRLRRDESGGGVTETRYVRHTDAGTVRVVELPPSYNEIQPQSEAS